jgi:SAM-dependent methyltransferase
VHLNSRLLFEKYALEHFEPGMRVLEIGPDERPSTYATIVGDGSIEWETLDLDEGPGITFRAKSEYEFPIPDDCYDVVLSGQVIEHVRRVWAWMREVARVCKVGGLVITINPVSWPFHQAPVDCWRIYPDGMKALYEEAGLDVLLSRWESLEATEFATHLPGRSFPARYRLPWVIDLFRALGQAGFPVERAYDTVTIGRKRDRG